MQSTDAPAALECVVVADDDPAMRNLLVHVLRLDGYCVDAYACGAALIDGLLQTRANGRTPSLILCDFDAPGGGGLHVLQGVREQGVEAPIVLSTAFVSENLLADAFASGVSVVLSKPFSTDDLRRVVRCLMSGTELW